MFQYAAAKRLAVRTDQDLSMDLSFLQQSAPQENLTVRDYELSIFKIGERFARPHEVNKLKNIKNKLLQRVFPGIDNPYVREKYFQFDPSILSLKGSHYLDGHWMTEKYFADIGPIIRSEFEFKRPVLEHGKWLQSKIEESESVAVQVRRGDYVTNQLVTKVHGITSIEYFRSAIDVIRTRLNNPTFFIFSDDSAWCIENFKELGSVFFVEKSLEGSGAALSDYFQLLTMCRHFVISNSTFAWWGAWLSKNDDKTVIAPSKWFADPAIQTTDIYPEAWIKI